MGKKIFVPVILLLFAIAVLIIGVFWWKSNLASVSEDKTTVRFLIPKGRSAIQVGNELFEEGLIRSPLAFKIYVQLFDKSKSISSGEFELSKDMSVSEIIEALGKGPRQVWVTVPEGLRKEEIAEKFAVGLEKTESEADLFREEFIALARNKEGYLYPDTYLLPPDASPQLVFGLLTSTFDKKIDDEMESAIVKSGRTLNEIVILASLVEKETKTDGERPIVAGIILKRIESGWTIDIDASIQYGVANIKCGQKTTCDDWWPTIYREDINKNGPYNSYKNAGLPPAPIANPGISSIKSAIYPEDSDYWYYIHDDSGKIHFARSLDEHNQNISKYLD